MTIISTPFWGLTSKCLDISFLCDTSQPICYSWFWFPFEGPGKLFELTGTLSGPPGVTTGAEGVWYGMVWKGNTRGAGGLQWICCGMTWHGYGQGGRGVHWGPQGRLMACNDPAWDRVISGLGLLVSAIHNEMFLTNDVLLFQNNAMLKKCFYGQSDVKLRGGKVLAVSGKYQTCIRYSGMPNM